VRAAIFVLALLAACRGASAPGSACDGSGNCNRKEQGCVRCAYAGVCKAQYDACHASPACNAFIACVERCDGLEDRKRCATKCEAEHAEEYEQLYRPMAKCAFCQACRADCQLPPDASLCR
jgi:hypothetical protein